MKNFSNKLHIDFLRDNPHKENQEVISERRKCTTCNGSGWTQEQYRDGNKIRWRNVRCSPCYGTGYIG